MSHHFGNLFDSDAKLPRTATLGDALHQAYASLYFALVDHQMAPTRELIEQDLPGRVFELAVDAGWIPDPSEVHQRTASPLAKRETGALGRFTVEKAYKGAFLWLLSDALFNATYDLDAVEKKRLLLPAHTTTEERKRHEKTYRMETSDPDTGKPLPVKELCAKAGIDYRSLKRWRQGPDTMPDRSPTAKYLMMLFLHGITRNKRKPKR